MLVNQVSVIVLIHTHTHTIDTNISLSFFSAVLAHIKRIIYELNVFMNSTLILSKDCSRFQNLTIHKNNHKSC